MPHYNILIGVDQKYYNDWGINLLKSIHYHNPWILLHCHIVNPSDVDELSFVDYTYETIEFETEDSRLGYLQAVRFLAVADKFSNNELVITLDADSICSKSFTEQEFSTLFNHTTVLQHPKQSRWLAGLISFNKDNFRHDYAASLREMPINEWNFGRDQEVLAVLDKKYHYRVLDQKWISIGKNKNNSVFLTLKGEQKTTEKYLNIFNKYKDNKGR
jgi:hypothetical protein